MRPQVVAHRGASHENAEHTLRAYMAALDAGADALECDVRLTADGHLVCVHDRDLRRTARRRGLVSTLQLSDLDQLDFASWKNPWADFEDAPPTPELHLDSVLTLRTLLETIAGYERRVEIAIETKHPTRFSSLVERSVVELLRDFGWAGPGSPARVMSFSWTALARVRRLAPALPVVMLVDRAQHWPALRAVVDDDWIVGPGIGELRDHPGLGRQILRSGRELHVWTVNSPSDLDLCLELGATAVITDRPAYVLDLLGV